MGHFARADHMLGPNDVTTDTFPILKASHFNMPENPKTKMLS